MKHERFFATCPKGLEQLLEEELQNLNATDTKQTVAGVHFKGSLETAYRACLWSRFASRILLPLATFPAVDAEDLYKGASKIPWLQHLSVQTTFLVNFSGASDALKHTQFAAQIIKDAIVDQFRAKKGERPSVDKVDPMLRINAFLRKGVVTISLDLSGESLHRRGYRLEGGAAPLKENLAAAILYRAKWLDVAKKGGSLLDPMCGSGTLLIEGVMMAADIAPGLFRKKFGFEGWKQHDKASWQKLQLEARERAKQGKLMLLSTVHGYDVNPDVILLANSNIKRAGLTNFIKLQVADVSQLSNHQIKKTYGLCITNPPYGERLFEEQDLLPLYREFAKKLKENFLNWEAAIFTGNPELSKNMGLRAYKKYSLYNGMIPCQLLLFHLTPEWFITPTM